MLTGRPHRHGFRPSIALLVLVVLASLLVPAAAAAGPQIKAFKMNLEGHNPGANYTVQVHAKVRVCAKLGPVRLSMLEQKTGFDHPPTVTGENRRSFGRRQHKPCQVYTPSWRLRFEFFGIGIYKVRIRVIDKNGEESRSAVEEVKTFD